jgi:hypothetical protein
MGNGAVIDRLNAAMAERSARWPFPAESGNNSASRPPARVSSNCGMRMSQPPLDQKPRIRLTSLSHGAG